MSSNLIHKIFIGILFILLITPFIPGLVAGIFVYPFYNCDAPMHAGNMGDHELNDPICRKWWGVSFAFGWSILLIYPLVALLTFIYAITMAIIKIKKS